MSVRRTMSGAIAVIALGFSVVYGATRDDFLYGNADDGSNLPFRYFVPPGYDGGHAYPLVLFLHGAGERGNDNEAQLNNNANGDAPPRRRQDIHGSAGNARLDALRVIRAGDTVDTRDAIFADRFD